MRKMKIFAKIALFAAVAACLSALFAVKLGRETRWIASPPIPLDFNEAEYYRVFAVAARLRVCYSDEPRVEIACEYEDGAAADDFITYETGVTGGTFFVNIFNEREDGVLADVTVYVPDRRFTWIAIGAERSAVTLKDVTNRCNMYSLDGYTHVGLTDSTAEIYYSGALENNLLVNADNSDVNIRFGGRLNDTYVDVSSTDCAVSAPTLEQYMTVYPEVGTKFIYANLGENYLYTFAVSINGGSLFIEE